MKKRITPLKVGLTIILSIATIETVTMILNNLVNMF